jgi:hypothetical protein
MGHGSERTIQKTPTDWRLPAEAGIKSTLRRVKISNRDSDSDCSDLVKTDIL